MRPGEELKAIRVRLGITTREVEEYSRKIAAEEGNEEFYVSNAWLTQIENKESIPSFFKLYSVAVIFRVKFTDLLLLFGVDLSRIAKHQIGNGLQRTHLTKLDVYDNDRTLTFPVQFESGFGSEKTNLLSRMVQAWGEVPIALIQHLDIRNNHYGFIGLNDRNMSPIIRPGSFVQIDQRVTKIQTHSYRSEYERPIYFVELRDGCACSWCELNGTQLTLVPHPMSGCPIRQFAFDRDAEIVGRVTAVAMRISDYLDL